ncbi:hypothetical protein L211DRAFT_835641 [Terfezia boudieri ATCC MYA-4762]|uniref:Uncharacterized protein n=1 Tax=Terfezia boudieri ATCC MYA-4762 TaxID=1051890 RepID=A0A3N4LTY7_9PEZI|nr:hypothetical protein L211DRAFT_835641 [Terfezia boudieri ATCC MYA-4762]
MSIWLWVFRITSFLFLHLGLGRGAWDTITFGYWLPKLSFDSLCLIAICTYRSIRSAFLRVVSVHMCYLNWYL